jgi:hypothetical protein
MALFEGGPRRETPGRIAAPAFLSMETDHLPGDNIGQKGKPLSPHLANLQDLGIADALGNDLPQIIR